MGDKTARTFTPDTKLRYVPIRSPVQPVFLPVGSLVPNKHSNYLLNKCSWEKGWGSPLCSNFAVLQEYLLKCLKKCSIAMNASCLLKKEGNMTAFLSIVVLKRRTEKELATLGTSRSRCGPNPRPDCRVLSPHLSHESLCRLRITQPVPAPLQRCYFLLNYKTLNSFLPHARSSPKSIASILG